MEILKEMLKKNFKDDPYSQPVQLHFFFKLTNNIFLLSEHL